MNILLIIYNLIFTLLFIPLGMVGYIVARVLGENEHYFQRLGLGLPEPLEVPSVWFHAASVGEVRSLQGIVADLRERYNLAIVVSTITESGYVVAVSELKADRVLLLPIENRPAIINAIARYQTQIFFITDTEIWPNLLTSIPQNVPLILLNGRISDKTFASYMRFSFIFAPIMKNFRYIIAKSDMDAERFRKLTKGVATVITGGNIKYNIDDKKDIANLPENIKGRVAFAASTHHPEEELFLNAALEFESQYDTIVIAPRHVKRAAEIAVLVPERLREKVVIIDKLGMLEAIYQVSERIFVGGSIATTGGHNIFEALKYEKQVCVGVHTENFSDITPLAVKYGVATTVHDEKELARYFIEPLEKGDFAEFFDELKSEQEEYISIIDKCVEECLN